MLRVKQTAVITMALAVVTGFNLASSTTFAAEQGGAEFQAALARWRACGYGMFIHFGMATYTGRANENDPRNADAPSTLYAPTNLDVDQWIRVAREAGMKYAVLTAKHTAGHCLWDSKVQFRGREFDYDVATSGNPTDVVAAFVKACKKYDIMPGLYWCLLDFHNNSVPPGPQWRAGKLPDDFFQLAQDQLAELIRNYPEVGYYWLDVPRTASAEQRRVIYDLIKRLRPGAIVLYNAHAPTIAACQHGWPTDVMNSERRPLEPGRFKPVQTWRGRTYHLGYEHCDCLAQHWFWYPTDRPRPIPELFRLYRRVRAGDGNLLLDVAPDRTGRIPAASIKALQELKQAIEHPDAFPDPLTLGAKTTASNWYHHDPIYRPEAATDGDSNTRWATDDGTHAAWLAVDLGKPVTVGRVVIAQAYPELKRVKKFSVEYRRGEEWKVVYRGGNLGAFLDATFAPVTASEFRLNITEATEGPTIWEFQLYGPDGP